MAKRNGNRGKGRGIAFLRANVGYVGDDCLLWPFGKDQDGYGRFGHEGVGGLKAHRWMCEQVRGPAPSPDHYAAHDCGNGHLGCITPKHLFWKTHAENTADMIRHGTTRNDKGGDRSKRKLDREKVAYIRAAKGEKTARELAEQFGVSYRQVTKIWQGISWSDDCRQEHVFTPEEIQYVRRLRKRCTQRSLAELFGVSLTVIWRIQHGKTYLHVPFEQSHSSAPFPRDLK